MLTATGAPPAFGLAEALLAEGRADEAELVLAQARGDGDGAEPAALVLLARVHQALDRPRERLMAAEAALSASPGDLGPALGRAEALEAAGRRREADAVLADVAARHTGAPAPHAARARLAERRDRPDLAEAHWRQVLALRPDDLPAHLGVTRASRAAGRFAEADARCRALPGRFPNEPGPAHELARVAYDAGELFLAEALWRRAAASGGKQAVEALFGLAQTLAAQHRFDDARAVLTTLGRAHPGRTAPLAALVRVMSAEGDLEAAESACRRLVVLEPERLAHWLTLGRVLERGADYAGAAALYAKAARERPQAAAPRLAQGGLALAQGDPVGARDRYSEVLELDPEHVEARLGLADAAAGLDDLDTAHRRLAEALALAPLAPKVWQRRARLLEEAGLTDEARLALLEARTAMPHRQEPRLWSTAFALRHGEVAAALAEAEAARSAHPRSLPVALAVADALLAAGRSEDARSLLEPLAEDYPEHRDVQKRLARLETTNGDVGRARRRWWRSARLDPRVHGPVDPLERRDRQPLPPAAGEVRVFLVVRNERPRLPWLLEYYRRLGADRFLVIDNASDDGTTEWLAGQGPDVHHFWTDASFGRSAAGMRWLHALLDEHGSGAWTLNVDADEALVYPRCEEVSLKALTRRLDGEGVEALLAPMLDMYAAGPMDAFAYEPGRSLIDAFPYFDAAGYVRRDSHTFPFVEIHGGCRARMFYPAAGAGPVLQKVPLVRWSPGMRYLSSRHTAMPCRLASVSGALLHFKFTPEFSAHVRAEVARAEHFRGGREYRAYLRRLEEGRPLSFLHPGSARYAGSRQLVELGLMATTPEFEAHADALRDNA